jgi:hypothetical protein
MRWLAAAAICGALVDNYIEKIANPFNSIYFCSSSELGYVIVCELNTSKIHNMAMYAATVDAL